MTARRSATRRSFESRRRRSRAGQGPRAGNLLPSRLSARQPWRKQSANRRRKKLRRTPGVLRSAQRRVEKRRGPTLAVLERPLHHRPLWKPGRRQRSEHRVVFRRQHDNEHNTRSPTTSTTGRARRLMPPDHACCSKAVPLRQITFPRDSSARRPQQEQAVIEEPQKTSVEIVRRLPARRSWHQQHRGPRSGPALPTALRRGPRRSAVGRAGSPGDYTPGRRVSDPAVAVFSTVSLHARLASREQKTRRPSCVRWGLDSVLSRSCRCGTTTRSRPRASSMCSVARKNCTPSGSPIVGPPPYRKISCVLSSAKSGNT